MYTSEIAKVNIRARIFIINRLTVYLMLVNIISLFHCIYYTRQKQANIIQMQSSKPYKIFGHGRGIDISQTPQGRNVQPFMSSKKLQQPIQRQIQSPFDGYMPALSSQNNLAISQVSDLNNELTRRIIKQELSKLNIYDFPKIKNDIDVMKTEIRSLKQNVLKNSNGKVEKDSDEIKQQIIKQVDKLFEQYHDQTARNLRQVIKKMDQTIKKDCATKFLTIDFVTDAEKQFLELQDRIQLLQSKMDGNKKQRQTEDPVVVAETLDLRLKKVQRQIESTKKLINEMHTQVSQLNENNLSMNTKQNDDDERVTSKIQEVKKMNNDYQKQIQKQLKHITNTISQLNQQVKANSQKVLNIQQNLQRSPEILKSPVARLIVRNESGQSSEVKQFLNSSKGLAVSSVFQNGNKQVSQDGTYKKLFKSPEKDMPTKTDSITEASENQKNSKSKLDQIGNATHCYQIDKNNFLLDEDGNYILNENGKQIQLSEDQLAILRQSTLVKLRE